MNYYPFHIGDYVSATRHLSWEEDAAFRRLLDTYYTTEKPLPADLRACCRLVMATTESQREAVRVVLEEFFSLAEEGWVNKRADEVIQASKEKQQKQRDKAIKRWHKPEPELGNASAMPQHKESDAVALKIDADAMPPIPIPIPIPKEEKEKTSKKEIGAEAPLQPQAAAVDSAIPDKPIRKSKKSSSADMHAELVNRGCPSLLADDFLKIRRTALTATAIAGIEREAQKAHVSFSTAIERAVERGWQTFDASWFINARAATSRPAAAMTVSEKNAALLAQVNGGMIGNTIESDARWVE